MAGFPRIPTRSSFGPTMEDFLPVRNPKKDLGAAPINLSFWQIAGIGRTVASAAIVFDPAALSGAGKITRQALTFDPKGEIDPISHTINAAGDYEFTFASSYVDETGTAVPFFPILAIANPLGIGANPLIGLTDLDGSTVEVRIVQAANGTLTSSTLSLLVWGNLTEPGV